jgi:hypothetical protein
MTGDTVLAALALCPAPPKMRPSRGVALPSTCATALNARKSAAFFAQLSTARGETPRHVAPLRRFYKRVARRAERRAGKHIDVEAAILDVSCDYCGRIACTDIWCGEHSFDDLLDDDVYLHSPRRGEFHDTFASLDDFGLPLDFDSIEDDGFDVADRDARAWRDLYDDLGDL